MNKINAVLVVLDKNYFKKTVGTLNFNKVNLVAIIIDGIKEPILSLGSKEIPLVPFSMIQKLLDAGKNFFWLINGFVNGVGDIWQMKKFLMNNGIPDENIVNFEVLSHVSGEWLANLDYIKNHGADFFATGISYTEVGLDLNYIPHLRGRGVNLSGSNQDLRQSYLTARYVFEHVAPGTIKFVFIGLAPYSFRYDNAESFSVCSRNLQYMLGLNLPDKTPHDFLLKNLANDTMKKFFMTITEQDADLNIDFVKKDNDAELPAKAVVTWEDELDNLTKKFRPETVEKNIQILKDYIKLCVDNGAKPIGIVFPFAPMMRKNYDAELLNNFRATIRQLEEASDFKCIDLFDIGFGYDCFYNMAHLNLKGAALASLFISLQLYDWKILSTENFCDANYSYFKLLANNISTKNYNAFLEEVFKLSAQRISRKEKIAIGFVLFDSSMWCGDDLYKFFADDERFEPTIFLCLRGDRSERELIEKDFWHGVEQFKSRGLNVVAVSDENFSLPEQDLLIFLTPYFETLPNAFQLLNLTARTLLLYIPYALNLTNWGIYNTPIYHIGWKLFFDTRFHVDLLKKNCRTGMARGLYSGYPKLDALYKNLQFDWKTSQPDAKKIIWAPHWSINDGVRYSTFQWNYQFMYDFAKAHPETSWVVKPHPNLFFSAIQSGLFDSAEAFEEYLQAWNDLPNAQVYTGGYYQNLFATSDGMILDCASFIGEYQYTHKPMIYLTRDTQRFNPLGEEILNVSYLVDGKNLDGIAELLQKIFVEGDDYKADERKKFFDEQLNYFAHNGMTASEFIYKSISQAFL